MNSPVGDIALRVMAALPGVVIGRGWQILPDFPTYLVGDDGTVISAGRKPRVLRPIQRGTYQGFTLADARGALRPVYLHRLVAEAWHGPCPEGHECRHLNGDKFDNRFGNLAWGTHSENAADTVRHGRSAAGARNPNAKLTPEQVQAMRRHRDLTGEPYAKIARRFGVSTMTAYRAIKEQSWTTM